MMAELSRDEFITHVEFIRADIRGVHERLDAQNGRLRDTEKHVAVLQADGCDRRCQPIVLPKQRSTAAGWGAGAAAFCYGAVEVLKLMWPGR